MKRLMGMLKGATVALGVFAGSSAFSAEAIYDWTGSGGDGDWWTEGNWSPAGVPSGNDAIARFFSDTELVNPSGDIEVGRLRVGENANVMLGFADNNKALYVGTTNMTDEVIAIGAGATLSMMNLESVIFKAPNKGYQGTIYADEGSTIVVSNTPAVQVRVPTLGSGLTVIAQKDAIWSEQYAGSRTDGTNYKLTGATYRADGGKIHFGTDNDNGKSRFNFGADSCIEAVNGGEVVFKGLAYQLPVNFSNTVFRAEGAGSSLSMSFNSSGTDCVGPTGCGCQLEAKDGGSISVAGPTTADHLVWLAKEYLANDGLKVTADNGSVTLNSDTKANVFVGTGTNADEIVEGPVLTLKGAAAQITGANTLTIGSSEDVVAELDPDKCAKVCWEIPEGNFDAAPLKAKTLVLGANAQLFVEIPSTMLPEVDQETVIYPLAKATSAISVATEAMTVTTDGEFISDDYTVETVVNETTKELQLQVTLGQPKVYVAQIGDQMFETVDEALQAIVDDEQLAGGTLKLLDSAKLTESIVMTRSFTLDLNGFLLQAADNFPLLTIDDGSTVTLADTGKAGPGVIEAGEDSTEVFVVSGGSLKVGAVEINGDDSYATAILIYGGSLEVNAGAQISGANGIVAQGGSSVVINGGEISANTLDAGAALVIDESSEYAQYGTPTVAITGGRFVADDLDDGAAIRQLPVEGEEVTVKNFIKDGWFSTEITQDQCVEGRSPVEKEGGWSVEVTADLDTVVYTWSAPAAAESQWDHPGDWSDKSVWTPDVAPDKCVGYPMNGNAIVNFKADERDYLNLEGESYVIAGFRFMRNVTKDPLYGGRFTLSNGTINVKAGIALNSTAALQLDNCNYKGGLIKLPNGSDDDDTELRFMNGSQFNGERVQCEVSGSEYKAKNWSIYVQNYDEPLALKAQLGAASPSRVIVENATLDLIVENAAGHRSNLSNVTFVVAADAKIVDASAGKGQSLTMGEQLVDTVGLDLTLSAANAEVAAITTTKAVIPSGLVVTLHAADLGEGCYKLLESTDGITAGETLPEIAEGSEVPAGATLAVVGNALCLQVGDVPPPPEVPDFINPANAAEVEKYKTWADTYSVTDPTTAIKDAYVLNCANDEVAVAAKKDAFQLTISFDENGKPVINLPDGFSYNGILVIMGATELAEPDWAEFNEALNQKFFKAVLFNASDVED